MEFTTLRSYCNRKVASGIFSSISGGGGAIIMIPAFIFSGLPPQIAVATAKMSGLGGDLVA